MLDNFSKQVIRIIEESKVIARSKDSQLVGTEHLLLSMMTIEDSICHFLLSEQNISISDIEAILEKYVILRKSDSEDIIFTRKYQEIILDVGELASRLNSSLVFDEHLFYCLLKADAAVAKEILLELKMNINDLLEDIEDIFQFNPPEEDYVYSFLTNISELVKKPNANKYISRGNHLEKIINILSKKQKNNPMLIGSAGVGKSAIVEGLAQELIKRNYKEPIYRLELGAMMAGTKYRGELEEKLIKAMNFIKEKKAILFIDEIHNIVGAGSNEGSLDIANILKPYLARYDIKCIGATTLEEYYRYIEKDKALMRRFQNIFIDEPTESETLMILEGIKDSYEEYHEVFYPQEILKGIVKKSGRFLINRKFPDKAIDILDELGARAHAKSKTVITSEMLGEIIKDMGGINQLSSEELRKLVLNYPGLKSYYLRFLKGESDATNIVVIEVEAGFNPEPLYQDLDKVFKLRKEMILEINLEEYLEHNAINNLIGSPAGYVGYETGGILSEHLIKYPMSVVYFKGIKHANFAIRNFLKRMLKQKTIMDNKGRTILLSNTIFILEKDQKQRVIKGFLSSEVNESISETEADIRIAKPGKKMGHDRQMLKYIELGLKEGYNIIFDIEEIKNPKQLEQTFYQILLEIPGTYHIYEKNNQYHYRHDG